MADSESKVDRLWWILGLVFVSGWCVYLYFFGPTLSTRNVPTLEGTALPVPADYDWELEDAQGKATTLGRYRGKTVFLNLWATWCGPCMAEMPSIQRLAGMPGLEGGEVAFVCVSIDQEVDAFRQFVASAKDVPMTFLHADPAKLPPVFTTDGIPATFVIAPDGRVAAAVTGGADWDDPSVVDFLKGLSRPQPSAPPQPKASDAPGEPAPKPDPAPAPAPGANPNPGATSP
jgi:thiol-disulfide isomerase/thioredoxin